MFVACDSGTFDSPLHSTSPAATHAITCGMMHAATIFALEDTSQLRSGHKDADGKMLYPQLLVHLCREHVCAGR